MKKEYDFSNGKAKRGAVVDPKATKVKRSMYMDWSVIEWATREGEKLGMGYQTFINLKLNELMTQPSLEKRIQKIEEKLKLVKV